VEVFFEVVVGFTQNHAGVRCPFPQMCGRFGPAMQRFGLPKRATKEPGSRGASGGEFTGDFLSSSSLCLHENLWGLPRIRQQLQGKTGPTAKTPLSAVK